jgi:hypothetical protein
VYKKLACECKSFTLTWIIHAVYMTIDTYTHNINIKRSPFLVDYDHYNKKGAYCNPNILANNKEIRFRKPAVPNTNSSQTLKPLRNPHLRTRTIASSLQLPKLNPLQHISDYNVFYTRFAIHGTSKIIENKSNIAKT